jgi:hypothetical protein
MIGLILTIALVGLVVYLITNFIPMPAPFKTIIYVIVVVFLIVWLVQILGVSDIPIHKLR